MSQQFDGDPASSALVRLHNLPRYTGVGGILHFLWAAVDFQPEEASVCAFSAKNAVVRFRTQRLADEAVQYCNGRSIQGHIVTVHPSNQDEIERVTQEGIKTPPLIKKIAQNREGAEKDNDGRASKQNVAFPGLHIDSDDVLPTFAHTDFDEMELRIPDFFLLGKYPDQVDFDQPSDGRSRSAATASTSRSNSSDSPDIEVIGQNHQQTQKKRKMSGTGANAIPLGPEKRFRPNEPFTGRPPPPQPFIRPPPGVQQQFPPMAPPNIHRPAPPQMPPFHAQEQQARQFFPPRHCAPPPPQPPQFFTPPPQFAGLPPPPPLACEPLAYVIEPLISSRHILLRWKFPENVNAKVDQVVDNQKLTIQGPDGDIRQLGVGKTIQKVFEVIAGRTYSVTLEGFDIHGQPVAYACGQMRASFSRNDMEMVLRKAKAFCGERMYPFEVLHRCKPKHYWDEIYNSGPDRIMHPYRKDENGHPGCPINGAINGLFFSTLLKGKNLPNDSPFGDIQMVISAGKLLDFRQCNMYFADFYCNEAKMGEQNNSSALHYVTVLVCRQGSTTDLFCRAKQMIQLDWSNNPFLQVRQSGSAPSGYQYLAVCREYSLNRLDLLVEVYYTEPVSLFDADEFNDVYAFGKGQSRPEGLPNNKQCKHCNVYDVRRCVKCQAPFPLYHGDMFDRCPGCDPISNRPSIFA